MWKASVGVLVLSLRMSQLTAFHMSTSERTIVLSTTALSMIQNQNAPIENGKLLVIGGTGFLGQMVCKRALVEGYSVTSLSRRGLPPQSGNKQPVLGSRIDYRQGDARKKEIIENILNEGGFAGVIHCAGLLFDDASGLGRINRFASGSGSVPDKDSTYDDITRMTAFNAIEATIEYTKRNGFTDFPFSFTSAAEAGWPDVPGGTLIEGRAPDFLKRYLAAKRAVESKLLDSTPTLRPIITRPSLVYSLDRPASFLPVVVFFAANAIGLPFVDRPVTVQRLSAAIVTAISRESVRGVLRYRDIDELSE